MDKWVEDIQMAIDLAEKSSGPTPEFLASSPPDNSKCGALQGGHGPVGAPPAYRAHHPIAFRVPSPVDFMSVDHTCI